VSAACGRADFARIRAQKSFGASSNDRHGDSISRALKVAQIIGIATETIGAGDVSNGKA